MRRNPPPKPPQRGKQYRVRAISKVTFIDMLEKGMPFTFIPGIIRNNRPKADVALSAALKGGYVAWLEFRKTMGTLPISEWEKIDE